LAALSHFDQPTPIKWIAEMTGLAEQAAETALDDLTDRSILIADNEARKFFLPSLTSEYIRKEREELVDKIGENLANLAYNIIKDIKINDAIDLWKNKTNYFEAALQNKLREKLKKLKIVVPLTVLRPTLEMSESDLSQRFGMPLEVQKEFKDMIIEGFQAALLYIEKIENPAKIVWEDTNTENRVLAFRELFSSNELNEVEARLLTVKQLINLLGLDDD